MNTAPIAYKSSILQGFLLAGLCAGILWSVFLQTDQLAFPYPLDDSYIHLSISKSWTDHGSMSVDPARFDFSTSSPLFTFLLAGLFLLTTSSVWWPMILGVASGLWLFFLVYRHFHSIHIQRKIGWIWIITLLTPFPLLMLMGMEHSIQVLICFLWVNSWLTIIEGRKPVNILFLLLTILLVTIRYEGLFLVAAACLWWAMNREWKRCLLLGVIGGSTVSLIGLFSMWAGGTFLPLSLLMKGYHPEPNVQSVLIFVQQTLEKIYEHPFIFSVVTVSAIGMWLGKSFPLRLRGFSFLLQTTSWIHILLAEIGGYRYEAYLVFLHLILLVELLHHKQILLSLKLILAGIWLLVPLGIRTAFFTINYPLAVQNIFHQSVQVGKFIQTYYPDAPIAIQDIGVAAWLNDFPLTDLAGIGDGEVNQLFRNHTISPETIRPILERRGVELAIIQQGWMGWVIPPHWQAAGSWTIQDHLIIALPEVFFWAANDEEYQELLKNLQEFSVHLPESIREEGPYVGTPLPQVERAP